MDCDWRLSYAGNKTRKRHSEKEINEADVFQFQRSETLAENAMISLLKAKGKKIIYDVDDALLSLDPDDPWNKVYDDFFKHKFKTILAKADAVTVSTENIKKELSPYHGNIIVVPNRVDPGVYDDLKKPHGKLRILLAGSVLQNKDASEVMDLLRWITEQEDMQLVAFGWLPPKHRKIGDMDYSKAFEHFDDFKNIEFHEGVQIGDYFRALCALNCDICLIPRKDNFFNKGKSPIKYLEGTLAGMAVIAQSFSDFDSPYDREKAQGAPIILASNSEDFKRQIIKFKDDKIRLKSVKENKKWVVKNRHAKNSNFDSVVDSLFLV